MYPRWQPVFLILSATSCTIGCQGDVRTVDSSNVADEDRRDTSRPSVGSVGSVVEGGPVMPGTGMTGGGVSAGGSTGQLPPVDEMPRGAAGAAPTVGVELNRWCPGSLEEIQTFFPDLLAGNLGGAANFECPVLPRNTVGVSGCLMTLQSPEPQAFADSECCYVVESVYCR